MLAGRKLLLADDSITIQKVVDLTFADEGVSVVCVNNGIEAIERLEESIPDVVLLDVFMPEMNGYEVCEYIKQDDKLRHIPVMLLVGSFEPFDEEEARRVGANDILTKPFQSIRRLIDKVGVLVGNRPPEEQIPTAELPHADVPEPEPEKLTTAELEISTADTQPLPAELAHVVAGANWMQSQQEGLSPVANAKVEEMMENKGMETGTEAGEKYEGAGEVLLDLGELDAGRADADDDFVLDIDLDELPEPSPTEPAFPTSAFLSRERYRSLAQASEVGTNGSARTMTAEVAVPTTEQLANTQQFERVLDEPAGDSAVRDTFSSSPTSQAMLGSEVSQQYVTPTISSQPAAAVDQLSPEMIEAIARKAVEYMSEKVVREIAWEVVPELAELLIKRQLEEKNS